MPVHRTTTPDSESFMVLVGVILAFVENWTFGADGFGPLDHVRSSTSWEPPFGWIVTTFRLAHPRWSGSCEQKCEIERFLGVGLLDERCDQAHTSTNHPDRKSV